MDIDYIYIWIILKHLYEFITISYYPFPWNGVFWRKLGLNRSTRLVEIFARRISHVRLAGGDIRLQVITEMRVAKHLPGPREYHGQAGQLVMMLIIIIKVNLQMYYYTHKYNISI